MAPPIRVSYDSIANLQFSNPDSPIVAHVNKVMSVEAMIRRNFSTDALRFERDLDNTTSTPSSGPDSPYSRMSRNLSQLLDDTDAEVDAKLMSRLQSTASLTNVRTAGAGQGYAGNLKKSLIVSTFDTISEDDLDGIMEALACYGPVHFKQHLTLSTFKVQFDHSADAEQAQAALDGHVMYPSGKLIRVSIECTLEDSMPRSKSEDLLFKSNSTTSLKQKTPASRSICTRLMITFLIHTNH